MKLNRVGAIGGALLVGVGVILAVTNPNQEAYEAFATRRLVEYLKGDGCVKAPTFLQAQCASTVEANRAEIGRIIAKGTQQQNYGLFSLYKTDLSVAAFLPSYHIESVGLLQQFHVYQAAQR